MYPTSGTNARKKIKGHKNIQSEVIMQLSVKSLSELIWATLTGCKRTWFDSAVGEKWSWQ